MSSAQTDPIVLVVDDDEETAGLLCELLCRRGFRATALTSGPACLEYLRGAAVDVVLSDINMPDMNGIELCRELRERHPELLTIMLTGVAELEHAIAAIRAGAYDFMVKPIKADLIEIAIKRALDHLAVRREVRRLRVEPAFEVAGIIGSSPVIRATVDLIRRAASSDATVLITGESGTGKELVARALHGSSSRAAEPFVAINCAAVPAALLESELFGHERGAFTDAKRARPGLFSQAGAGTILLDEIGDMPLEMQVKLLRALQERKVRPIGADEEHPFACRIVAATNRDLEHEVAEKRFREDLFYRINVVAITVPPLRERGDDVLELARLFLGKAAARSRRDPKPLSPAATRRLLEYDWPGNVRELENSIERAIAIAAGPAIEVDDLPERIAKFESSKLVITTDAPEELVTLDELHRRYVRHVLAATDGNKTHAARLLGIDRRSLYRRLEQAGVAGKRGGG